MSWGAARRVGPGSLPRGIPRTLYVLRIAEAHVRMRAWQVACAAPMRGAHRSADTLDSAAPVCSVHGSVHEVIDSVPGGAI